MAGRYRRPVTPAQRQRRDDADQDKLAALHGRLTDAVADLHSGPQWRAWLDVAGRFHSYSFNNVLAISIQRPDATLVAGYQTWRTLGRQVGKGETGIQILAPIVRRATDDDDRTPGGEAAGRGENTARPVGQPDPTAGEPAGRRLAGFRVAYVWDVAQTTGEPLPEQPRPRLLTGQAPDGLWDAVAGLVTDGGFTAERGDCGPRNGYTDFTARTVRVRGDVDDAQAAKTLLHEAAHTLLHHPTDPAGAAAGAGGGPDGSVDCRGVREVEAESVAYLVAAAHGLPTDDYTFGYVTGWATDAAGPGRPPAEVVRATGQRVLHAAHTILAVTQPDPATGGAGEAVQARVRAGLERATATREHAETVLAQTRTPAPAPARGPAPAPAPDRLSADERVEALARLHADAAAFYTAQLASPDPHAARARVVLAHRAVPPAAAAGYELGYAPPGWTALTDHLRGRGYTDTQLLEAGVGLTTRRGTVVDRFRDRIMFPVRDPTGEPVIAFIGRAMVTAEGTPKYLNSPETLLYRKGDVLYGLGAPPTRQALADGARPVLVEGALDAIAITNAGAGRYVGLAPSGTALTGAQVAVLDRTAGPLADRGVLVCFDADPAGRQAALRAFPLLRAAGAWPDCPDAPGLPDGADPASYAQQHGGDALRAVLDAASPLADHAVDEQLAGWPDRDQWVEGRVGAARDAARLVASFPPGQIARQVGRIAAHTGLDSSTVTGLVVDAVSRDTDAPGQPAKRHFHDEPIRGQPAPAVAAPPTAVRVARAGYPTPIGQTRPMPAAAPAHPTPARAALAAPYAGRGR